MTTLTNTAEVLVGEVSALSVENICWIQINSEAPALNTQFNKAYHSKVLLVLKILTSMKVLCTQSLNFCDFIHYI